MIQCLIMLMHQGEDVTGTECSLINVLSCYIASRGWCSIQLPFSLNCIVIAASTVHQLQGKAGRWRSQPVSQATLFALFIGFLQGVSVALTTITLKRGNREANIRALSGWPRQARHSRRPGCRMRIRASEGDSKFNTSWQRHVRCKRK